MEELILKHALLNAVEHEGKANANAVLGKILTEDESLKEKIPEVMQTVQKIVLQVNSMTIEQQKKKVDELGVVTVEKKVEEEYTLPELQNVEIGKVITAFPPEPSKYPHIGHAKSALLNFLYAKKYKGKFILRFEDSNPELAKKEYYEALLDGLKWVGIKWDKLDYLSNHILQYYKIIEKFLTDGSAYVCTCKQEVVKTKRTKGEECVHRLQDAKINLKLWKKMLRSYPEGKATVRLKIDMNSPNTTLRDPAIARIITVPHPRTKRKFRVWPVYDFGTVMLDVWEKVTHRVRSKEFEIRRDLQHFIHDLLKTKPPITIEIGRFEIRGTPTKGRVIREMIKQKQITGWDDPRLTTLSALKRRGFLPEAIQEFLISTGVTKAEGILEWEALEAVNRKHVDKIANRFFAVLNPMKIKIINSPKIRSTKVHLHPDFPRRGYRKIPIDMNSVFIEKEDFEKLENRDAALMYLETVKLDSVAKFITNEVRHEDPKLHWVSEPNVKIKIFFPDGKIRTALAEPAIKKVKVGQMIQLVRVGFCRVDKVGREILLYYTHK